MSKTRVIDVHSTFYPRAFLDRMETRTRSPLLKQTGPTSMVIYVNDAPLAHIDRPGHYDPEVRLRDMDAAGIDTQMIALCSPFVDMLDAREAVEWSKRINDLLAEVCQKYPGRFYAHATLPFQDIDAALKELDRAHKELGCRGILMFSNINGKPLASPEFYPIYARAGELGIPVFLHPGVPLTLEVMKAHKLSIALYGYIYDTSTAIMSLIWQGVLEKYPKLTVLHSHLGGIVPYSIGRVDDCWRAFHEEMGLNLAMKPSEYYRRQVYVDTISYFMPAMKCCLDFIGADHICLGTDYAHRIGNIEEAVDWVRKFDLPEKETNKILGENAAKIFKIK